MTSFAEPGATKTRGRGKTIAFYAPMKPPGHASPSGDRQMARLLMRALQQAGYGVQLASELRVYLRDPDDVATYKGLLASAEAERQRIEARWRTAGPPDLWICYHPYHKSPDLLGPALCRTHNVPWITVEASQSRRKSVGCWADFRERALDAVLGAKVNIALTQRDKAGLLLIYPDLKIEYFGPFLDAGSLLQIAPAPRPNHLVTVAMMREGDKSDSYAILAKALGRLNDTDWHLTVVGDGPASERVQAMFRGLPGCRITWAGELRPEDVADVLSRGAVYAWPGNGEAFGLAYLEAQAAGLPVVAQNTAGVPEVVSDAATGFLTPEGDVDSFADAIRVLLADDALRRRLGAAAREKVRSEHSIEKASERLDAILQRYVWRGN